MRLRNPFPMTFKVFKYDFIYLSKTFIPVYSALLSVGIIFCFITACREQIDTEHFLFALFLSLAWMIFVGVYFSTIIIIFKRFTKSMLRSEAYMNLSLPVTIGEHLWGRILSAFCWLTICGLISILTFIIAIAPVFYDIVDEIVNLTGEQFEAFLKFFPRIFGLKKWPLIIWGSTFTGIMSSIVFITFLFCTDTVANLAKKHKTLATVIFAVIVLSFALSVYTNIQRQCIITGVKNDTSMLWHENLNQVFLFKEYLIYTNLFNIMALAAMLGLTHFIFSKKLNLE